MFANSNNQEKLSSAGKNKLLQIPEIFKQYNENRTLTRRDIVLTNVEEEFKKAYPEICMERGDEINPLTGCAHGTNAFVALFGIMFSDGQLLPLNEVKKTRVLDIKYCESFGNQNFVSAVCLNSIEDKEVSLDLVLHYAEHSNGSSLDKDVFLKKIKKRCKDVENIYSAASNALDDKVVEFFKKLSEIPVVILGNGVGKFDEDVSKLTRAQDREVLYERLDMRIIAVAKEHIPLVSSLAELCPELKIAVIDKEELLEFTAKYNTECDNTTGKSFMEAVIEKFKPSLKFSEKIEPTTITKCSIRDGNNSSFMADKFTFDPYVGLIGYLDQVKYHVKNLEQRQKFYNENDIKDAINKGLKINDNDPIVYALFHGILLDNKFPIIYAMENVLNIEGIDPTLWAKVNKYKLKKGDRKFDLISHAVKNHIKIEGMDPKVWRDTVVGKERIEDEKKKRKEKLHSVVNVEQPQKSSTVISSSPTVDTEDPKPKSNSKYCYIGVFTIAGLAIGLIAAHIAGAPEVVFIVAAVAGMLIGAAFGVGIDYGISKCFANPNVEAHKQPGLVLHK